MKRQICAVVSAAALATALGVVPASAGGAAHYTWNDGLGGYGGPAAAVVNSSGAVVWWQMPGTVGPQYKDVYKLKAFGGSSAYPVTGLGEPVRTLFIKAFPTAKTVYYTREVVSGVPSFPQGKRLP